MDALFYWQANAALKVWYGISTEGFGHNLGDKINSILYT